MSKPWICDFLTQSISQFENVNFLDSYVTVKRAYDLASVCNQMLAVRYHFSL